MLIFITGSSGGYGGGGGVGGVYGVVAKGGAGFRPSPSTSFETSLGYKDPEYESGGSLPDDDQTEGKPKCTTCPKPWDKGSDAFYTAMQRKAVVEALVSSGFDRASG